VDFFARQEQSRRNTRALIALFTLAVIAIVVAVTLVTAALITMLQQPSGSGVVSLQAPAQWLAANASELGLVALLTAAFIGLASLYRIISLGNRGGQVARLLGATEVTPGTTDLLERRLINVVEEMAIASGTPVPEIFVLEQEHGINAFAAGLTPSDAAIAVTRGALDRLTRAELQGVIAHEFSHVLNGDMRLNQRLIGFSFGILALSLTGRWLLRSFRYRRRGRSGSGAYIVVLFAVALTIIGAIGLFFSRLIKAGVSRQREMLADASAVQFTRDRDGLAGALKKIGGYTGEIVARNGEEVAHMLFSRGAPAFSGWFATHPPLDERIQALDPAFRPGDYPPVEGALPSTQAPDESLVRLAAGADAVPSSDAALLERAGQIASQETAAALLAAIPEDIDHAAHPRELSLLLVLALGLSRAPVTRELQLELLAQQLGAQRSDQCRVIATELDRLEDRLRLPILELCVPALKLRPKEQLEFLIDLLSRIGALNPRPRLFDFVLARVLMSYVRTAQNEPIAVDIAKPNRSVHDATSVLLRCVAAYGHDEPEAAHAAYAAAMSKLFRRPKELDVPTFAAFEPAGELERLDGALSRLERLRPKPKRRLLMAVLGCIHHDRRVTVEEHELLRAIAASLGCPMPPLNPSA